MWFKRVAFSLKYPFNNAFNVFLLLLPYDLTKPPYWKSFLGNGQCVLIITDLEAGSSVETSASEV